LIASIKCRPHEMGGILHPIIVGTQYENVLVKRLIMYGFTRTVRGRT